MIKSILVAMSKNRVIGVNNRLPWHLPEDLRRFKNLTMNHSILMGRKTFESIGKPLPGRNSIVISRNLHFQFPGVSAASSIERAVSLCKNEKEIFFIGGSEIYRQALPLADRIYLTEIQKDFEGDAFFPEFDLGQWRETQREKHDGGLAYDFVVYERVRPPVS